MEEEIALPPSELAVAGSCSSLFSVQPSPECCHRRNTTETGPDSPVMLLIVVAAVLISGGSDFEWQRGYFLYTEGVSAYIPVVAEVLFPACSGPCGGRGVISCTQGYSQ
ncbi:uncharacterized protein [Arachis hypogaea]|uniref:uncharacterized protein isoform X2 n=1 Tax=Arachis hypogaea TaxID=3818 RepID=UPI003B219E89